MPAYADLVHQTTTSTGTGALTLTAVNGKRSFLTAFGTGGTNTFDYFVSHRTAAEWERGTGHESGNTLVRDTVLASSNAGAAVNFSAGVKDATNDQPAGKRMDSTGSSMSGDLDINKATPQLRLLKTAGDGQSANIWGFTGAQSRWVVCIGDSEVEGGGNTGSDFSIHRYGDASAYLGMSLNLDRATGRMSLEGDPTAALHAATKQYVDVKAAAVALRGQLYGLRLTNSSANVIDVEPGQAASDDSTPALMNLSGSLLKTVNTAWAAGGGSGAWDGSNSGAPRTDGWVHVFLIGTTAGGADILCSDSATAPTMPGGWTYKRRIGSLIRLSSAMATFVQVGDWFWTAPYQVYNSAASFGPTLLGLYTPAGVRTRPLLMCSFQQTATGGDTNVYLHAPDDVNIYFTPVAVNVAYDRTTTTVIGPPTNLNNEIYLQVVAGNLSVGVILSVGWIDDRGRT